ncbi:MAG TPA: putative metal-dependent hydrolase [Patescibacteria group bacterium]|nr:putative metal-dependent hydrolase [Patescibacteria group bacterium]
MDLLRFPIGKFDNDVDITDDILKIWISEIEELPKQLREATKNLTSEQRDMPYRPGGWTVQQTIHHIADSHMNSFIRFKLALTEDLPTIKPYEEALWAELPDGKNMQIEISLQLLQALHERWVMLLKSLSEEQLNRKFIHPDSGEVPLKTNIGIYAWHGKHHLAHITSLKKRMNW